MECVHLLLPTLRGGQNVCVRLHLSLLMALIVSGIIGQQIVLVWEVWKNWKGDCRALELPQEGIREPGLGLIRRVSEMGMRKIQICQANSSFGRIQKHNRAGDAAQQCSACLVTVMS